MNDFFIKTNDRLPVLRANLSDANGYIDLAGATVKFVFQTRDRTLPPTTGSATILGSASGYVEYAWATGDVASPNVYYGEWRVATASSKQISIPNDAYVSFEIVQGLT
jgi:hypothetical protein